MLSLKEKISNDFKKSLRERDKTEISTLRLLRAAVLNREKEKRYKITKQKEQLSEKELEQKSLLSDEEILEMIASEIKKRKEAIEMFKKGNREELAQREKKEIEILKKYLPKQLSEEKVKEMAKEIIEKLKAKELKTTTHPPPFKEKNIYGKAMAELMPRIKGRADGSLVSRIVKELLSS